MHKLQTAHYYVLSCIQVQSGFHKLPPPCSEEACSPRWLRYCSRDAILSVVCSAMSQIKLALAGRKGDQQLIKACIAAQLGRTPVEVSVTKDHAPGSASSLVTLKLSDGVLVTDCNTICRLLGGVSSSSQVTASYVLLMTAEMAST